MITIRRSEKCELLKEMKCDPIILIYQFFVHKNTLRQAEITECLRLNVANPNISKIVLLNEKVYSEDELGVKSDKIQQVNVGQRLRFRDIFEHVHSLNIQGYIVTCNADIFFDKTLKNLYRSGLDKKPIMLAQLRFEYTDKNLAKCKLFGPRCDSQDAWIFHSNWNVPKRMWRVFNINYGIGGCDNKVAYLFGIVGFELRNDPYFVKAFHHHKTAIREHRQKPIIPRPWLVVIPHLYKRDGYEIWPIMGWCKKYKIDYYKYTDNEKTFVCQRDAHCLRVNLNTCMTQGKQFIVPKIETNAANVSYQFLNAVRAMDNGDEREKQICMQRMHSSLNSLADGGLKMEDSAHLYMFSAKYLEVFGSSPISLHYAPGDIFFYNPSPEPHKYIMHTVRKNNKLPLHMNLLNIGEQLEGNSWIELFEDKKILIVSRHWKRIEEQVAKKQRFYNKDLFKGCCFTFMDIPTAEGDEIFTHVINKYISALGIRLGEFEITLIAETPYSFFILDYLSKVGKSAIDVGELLSLYFGLYSKKTYKSTKDVLNLYMNKHWSML